MNRRHVLAGGLAATLVVAAVVGAQDVPPDEEIAAAVGRPRPAAGPVPPSASPAGAPAPRSIWPEPGAAALAAWAPPPRATAPAPPATSAPDSVPPPAPPFPYRWFGLLTEGGTARAMLGNEQRSVVVQAGDTVDDRWHVDRIDETGIDLRWLPTGQAVPLAFR